MSPTVAVAIFAGFGLGLGSWLTLARLPVMRPGRFADRIAPQLRAADAGSRLLAGSHDALQPFVPLERILRPLLHDLVGWLTRFNPTTTVLSRRLVQAGSRQSAVDFRAQQILWGAGGLAVSTGGVLALAVSAETNILFAVTSILGCGVAGFLFRDYSLSRQIMRRERRMLAEFPGLAELMALAVSAGESATGALERVCRTANGELAGEFARVLGETRAGAPLLEALQSFAGRTQSPPLARFVDGLSVALERGTPLADVLRAQAQDVRDTSKRELMEAAGRKEIAMMVPLVFGILPLTVVFAVYPGLALLHLGF